MFGNMNVDQQGVQWQMNPMGQLPQIQQQQVVPEITEQPEMEETDNAHRPPNAFILYSQAMRSQVRQENPSLSNTEVSRLLGKMWKEVPSELKLQYKQKAAAMQEEFKREHPDYTYRKARRKRALNELLTKSSPFGMPMASQFPQGDMPPFTPGMMPGFPMSGYSPMGAVPPQGADPSGAQQPGAPPAGQSSMAFPGMQVQMPIGMPVQMSNGMGQNNGALSIPGYPGMMPPFGKQNN